ncbi:hypothetical protein [Actinomadura meyerae]|uniref:hypothetical protein n=1 Tax=Actinomadura meyerae TaxID=240840 RepID=UPI001177D821|nr:hypothetical protein [Actinomadura meyerae]
MPWQEFVIKVMGELLDWPLFGLIAVLMFRRPIRAAISRLTSYEGLGGTLTFGEQLAEVEEQVEGLAAPEDASQKPRGLEPARPADEQQLQANPDAGLLLLVQEAPSGAVMQAWSEVERSIHVLFQLHDLENISRADAPERMGRSARVQPTNMVLLMVERRIIPGSILKPIRELRALRNSVAHGQHTPTPGEALTYVETAREIREILGHLASLHRKTALDES